MYHLCAYTGAIGQTVNTDIAALTDGVLTISNGHFRLTDQASVIFAAAMSASLQRAKLDSPTLRINGNPYILPPCVGAIPLAEPRVHDMTDFPLPLPRQEEIAMLATSDLAMMTEQFTGLLGLRMSFEPVPPGRIQWVRITSTTAAVANVWTNIALTFESSLPTGFWSLVGLRGYATNAQAFRVIFPGKVWRPGIIANVAKGGREAPLFLNGSCGEMGRFVNDNPFQIETLNNGTDNAHVLYAALVSVGSL